MSINLLREKQMQAAELEVLYWERKLWQLEKPRESARGETEFERGWREAEKLREVQDNFAAKKEHNFTLEHQGTDPKPLVVKKEDYTLYTKEDIDEAVEAYKKRLVEKLKAEEAGIVIAGKWDEGYQNGFYDAIELVEDTD